MWPKRYGCFYHSVGVFVWATIGEEFWEAYDALFQSAILSLAPSPVPFALRMQNVWIFTEMRLFVFCHHRGKPTQHMKSNKVNRTEVARRSVAELVYTSGVGSSCESECLNFSGVWYEPLAFYKCLAKMCPDVVGSGCDVPPSPTSIPMGDGIVEIVEWLE